MKSRKHCSICGEAGHTKTTCLAEFLPRATVVNGVAVTPPTAPERCPTCDKPRAGDAEASHKGGCTCAACLSVCWRDWGVMCEEAPWRARAIAAEIRAEEAEAHGAGSDALIDAICQRVGARDTGCGGQTVEAGEMRRRMNMTQRIDMLTTAAAQWAKVAPLIERLRAEVGSRDVYRSPYDLIDAVHFLLAATEATP